MTLPDEQRKQIEQEAEKKYKWPPDRDYGKPDYKERTGKMFALRLAYKKGATHYAILCHQKDEQIKRLRQGLENVRRACSATGNNPQFRDSVINDIDSIAEETLEINK